MSAAVRHRFVKVHRFRKADGTYGPCIYTPVELRNGNLYPLDAKHYENVESAWKVIETILDREWANS